MFTSAALIDMHAGTHSSLQKYLDHCAGLAPEKRHCELDGFGHSSIHRQLHHAIWGEEVWMCVLRGNELVEERIQEYPTLETLRAYHEKVAAATVEYLHAASDEALNAPREVTVGEGRRRRLIAARVLLRIVTHTFHHQGQIAAMCRLLGQPIPSGLDFPVAKPFTADSP